MKKIIKEQIENLKGLYALALNQFIFMYILVFLFFCVVLVVGIGFLIFLYPLTLLIIIPIVSIIIFKVWYKRREKSKKRSLYGQLGYHQC